ncbi:MAG TPA: NAD(P)H-hydrate dehydratase [Clostridia bacterium]|nr:NAD(P)H-hydrate dehydratase [Clostridia bacterium]
MRILTVSQMKKAEQYATQHGVSALRLMENAGSAAARVIRESFSLSGKRCTVVCGRGNNGGDGLVIARRLHDSGASVIVVFAAGLPATGNAKEMLERLRILPVAIVDYSADASACLDAIGKSQIIVDAVFGTGFHGEIAPDIRRLFDQVNTRSDTGGASVFAVDMPSGANADTGEVAEGCIRAHFTVTFEMPKTGHFAFPAAEFCGEVKTAKIGIPQEAFSSIETSVDLLEYDDIKAAIPARAKDSNKGSYGRLFCLCGSMGMAGAARMPAAAALRSGAGLVTLGVPRGIYPVVASHFDEAMIYPLRETDEGSISLSALDRILEFAEKADAVLIGCGLSKNSETVSLVKELIGRLTGPVVLDADGINAMEGHIDLLRASKAELILTPHPGEMARLLGKTIPEIQGNRIRFARNLAGDIGATVALKGAYTVVASKAGRVSINPTGNPGMARGGSGDILAGIIAAFAAQHFSPENAVCCGVYLHGLAGDRCAKKYSQYGMLPTDMLLEVPQIFREMSR